MLRMMSVYEQCLFINHTVSPSSQIDIIWATMIVRRITG